MDLMEMLTRAAAQNFFEESRSLPIKVQGRIFPLNARTEKVRQIPPQFRSLPLQICRTLALSKIPKGKTDKLVLYEAYHKSMDEIGIMYEELSSLLGSIVEANIDVRTDWMVNRRKQELMQEKTKEWAEFMPNLNLQRPAVLRLDLDRKPEFIIRQTLDLSLTHLVENLVLRGVEAFDMMVDMELVGIIRWASDESCQYHYFKQIITEHVTDQRLLTSSEHTSRIETRKSRVETDVEQTHQHGRYVHELVGAKNHALPVKGIPMPERVVTLKKAIPSWLVPLGRVVTGTEIHRRIILQDLRTETKTDAKETTEVIYKPDPALVLGFYVLTGWNDDEV